MLKNLMLIFTTVALRKESVDRNFLLRRCVVALKKSLSARRAWIEICGGVSARRLALSLSARRAWIEIELTSDFSNGDDVALRKESVDRNSTEQASFRACTTVALRKESVDRNVNSRLHSLLV